MRGGMAAAAAGGACGVLLLLVPVVVPAAASAWCVVTAKPVQQVHKGCAWELALLHTPLRALLPLAVRCSLLGLVGFRDSAWQVASGRC
jgi:hypothetical protein